MKGRIPAVGQRRSSLERSGNHVFFRGRESISKGDMSMKSKLVRVIASVSGFAAMIAAGSAIFRFK